MWRGYRGLIDQVDLPDLGDLAGRHPALHRIRPNDVRWEPLAWIALGEACHVVANATVTVIGHDLALGGVRVEPDPDVVPGWHPAHLALAETDGDETGVRISIHDLTDVGSDSRSCHMLAFNADSASEHRSVSRGCGPIRLPPPGVRKFPTARFERRLPDRHPQAGGQRSAASLPPTPKGGCR